MNAGNHRYAFGSSVRIGAKTRLKIVTRASDTLGTGGFFAQLLRVCVRPFEHVSARGRRIS